MTPRLQRLSRQLDEAIEFAIDLGKRYDPVPSCSPLASSTSISYPSLYIDREDDSLDDLPDEGKATIHYKVKSRTKSEYDGKKSRSVSVDVMSIEPEDEEDEEEDEEDVKRQRLSAIIERLNEFENAYVGIDETRHISPEGIGYSTISAKKGKGVSSHLKRNAGKYAGATGGTVIGSILANAGDNPGFIPAGALIGVKAGQIIDRLRESRYLKKKAGEMGAGKRLAAIIEGLNEFMLNSVVDGIASGASSALNTEHPISSNPAINRQRLAGNLNKHRKIIGVMRGRLWNAKMVGQAGVGAGAAIGTIGGLLRKPKDGESRIGNAARGLLKGAAVGGITGAVTGGIFRPGQHIANATSRALRGVSKSQRYYTKFQAIANHLTEFMDRTRDDMGRFQANQTGGIDPLTVKQAYPKKSSMLRTAGLVAVGAGAAKFGPGMIRSARKAIQNRAGLATGKVATVKATKTRMNNQREYTE